MRVLFAFVVALGLALATVPAHASMASGETVLKPQPKPTAAKKKAAEKTGKEKTATKDKKDTKKSASKTEEPAATEKPVKEAAAKKTKKKKKIAEDTVDGEAALPVVEDTDETNIPDYPAGARVAMGTMKTYVTNEEDTLLDIARHFGLGYVETRAANLDMDPWAPAPGTEITIPTFHILPRARQEGIVVNLAEMRLYYFRKPGAVPETYPIGIGRDGLQTPLGQTTVIRKAAYPTWFPTARMREEKEWLPAAVPPGPSNPLGTHALYLGWPEFRIHGSNKPWAIGRRVSSGCMRTYPEDIIKLFNEVPDGTKVTVVDQPIQIARVDGTLYIEAHPTKTQSNDIEISGAFTPKDMDEKLQQAITRAAGTSADLIDWSEVRKAIHERKGYPVAIAKIMTLENEKMADTKTKEKAPAARPAAAAEKAAPATPQRPRTYNN